MAVYRLKCLLCGHENPDLVAIQEHVMEHHHYARPDLRFNTKRQPEPGHFIYTMPDGRDWLDARRTTPGGRD